MGFSRQDTGVSIAMSEQCHAPAPGDLPNLGLGPLFLTSSALAGEVFIPSATWEALLVRYP